MVEGLDIRGGAGEFEAAVIAVVIDEIERARMNAVRGASTGASGVSAWVRALHPEEPNMPRELVRPERR